MKDIKQLGLEKIYDYIENDPEKNLKTIMKWVDNFAGTGEDTFEVQRKYIRDILDDPDSNWYKLIMRVIKDTDREVVKTVFTNFLLNAAIKGWGELEKNKEKYGYDIPFTILVDPTTACNKKCIGCWAADYNKALNLSFEQLDKLFTEGKELGIYFYIMTGGEPLVRKNDILKLAEKHDDCVFMIFTKTPR